MTTIRWEENGVFAKPKRRVRNRARIWTEAHFEKIQEYWRRAEDPPQEPRSELPNGKKGRKK